MNTIRLAAGTLLLSLAWLSALPARAEPCGPPPPADTALTGVWISPSGEPWVVGARGALGHRTATGSWCWQAPFPDEPWTAVWGTRDDDVRFVSARGAIVHHDGVTFVLERAPDGAQLDDVWGTGPRDVYAAGTSGRALHFDGEVWNAIDPEPGIALRSIWGTDPEHVWAVGRIPTRTVVSAGASYSGVDLLVMRRTDAGWQREASWSQPYGGGGLSAIHGTSAHDVWAVGLNQPAGAATAVSIAVHFDGERWSRVPLGGLDTWRGFRGVTAGLPGDPFGVLIMTSDGALRGATPTTDPPADATRIWTRDLEAPPLLNDVASRAGALWAVGPNLTVLRTTDAAWTRELLGL